MNLEHTILSSLVFNEKFSRKVLPYLDERYFTSPSDRLVFSIIASHLIKYNETPTKEVLSIELESFQVSEDLYKETKEKIKNLGSDNNDFDWLVDKTEDFCKDKAMYNALMDAIEIADNKVEGIGRGAIPDLMQKALAVSFDESIGHDWLEGFEDRYKQYHNQETKIPFDLELFNKITEGGPPKKTLNVVMGGTGGGKSITLGHIAASNMMDGKNVLYITLELSEVELSRRIDANLLDTRLQEVKELPHDVYVRKILKQKAKTTGKLIIKEYPTSGISSVHIKNLIRELKTKKNFEPDVIIVDYINLMLSSRYKLGASINTYQTVKACAEELRGIAVEHNVVMWTATQVNRSGYGSSDIDLTDTAESFGLPATADFMFVLITTEDFDRLGQVMIKQLKNRYNDVNYFKRFMVGMNRSKMKLYDVEQESQENIQDSGQTSSIFDNTTFGKSLASLEV